MGKAGHAPNAPQPTRYVTDHAIDRMRERAKAAAHLDDDVLRGLLDDAISSALPKHGKEVRDNEGELATIVRLDQDVLDGVTMDGAVYALIKANRASDSKFAMAVITVLPETSMSVKSMLAQTQLQIYGPKPVSVVLRTEDNKAPAAMLLLTFKDKKDVIHMLKEGYTDYDIALLLLTLTKDEQPTDIHIYEGHKVELKFDLHRVSMQGGKG